MKSLKSFVLSDEFGDLNMIFYIEIRINMIQTTFLILLYLIQFIKNFEFADYMLKSWVANIYYRYFRV